MKESPHDQYTAHGYQKEPYVYWKFYLSMSIIYKLIQQNILIYVCTMYNPSRSLKS